jgi:8-oxo-dGTP pyrophosphatase MutT (NUDIX family)
VPYAASALSIRADLDRWRPVDPAQAGLRDEYLVFLDVGGAASLRRDGGPEHLTASCFVFTPDLSQVLLSFHRKGQFWVQLGGHVEAGDASVPAAALREAVEEGGIADLVPLALSPVDVDRHSLGDGFGACTVHWDVGYAAVAPAGAVPVVSDESEHVAWWPVDALPDTVPPGFARRLAGVLRELRARGVAPLHAG